MHAHVATSNLAAPRLFLLRTFRPARALQQALAGLLPSESASSIRLRSVTSMLTPQRVLHAHFHRAKSSLPEGSVPFRWDLKKVCEAEPTHMSANPQRAALYGSKILHTLGAPRLLLLQSARTVLNQGKHPGQSGVLRSRGRDCGQLFIRGVGA